MWKYQTEEELRACSSLSVLTLDVTKMCPVLENYVNGEQKMSNVPNMQF